ncbi:MAG: ferrous iron transport protein A [Methanosarcinales archaeon]|jgi:Fe2+ transport system protein FeoA|nr:ferrous iron transport protein A [Methanosarcinales archaeon]
MNNCKKIKKISTVSLDFMQFGKSSIIVQIDTDPITWKRMRYMGIRTNKSVKKIALAPFKGPALIEVNGCKLAIDRNLLSNIMVKN